METVFDDSFTYEVHNGISISGAPLVMQNVLFLDLCTVVISLRLESNGISCILLAVCVRDLILMPESAAAESIAFSVGSPITLPFWIVELLHRAHMERMSIYCFEEMESSLSELHIFVTFMRFCVSVPVLSEHITVVLPRVSTAGRRLIIALFFAILVTPSDSIIVTIAGSPSGIAATARLTAVMNMLSPG